MNVKRFRWPLGALACLALIASDASAANLLVNPGFEAPVTQDGPPFVGFWEVFNGGAGASGANSSIAPRTGAQHLIVSIANTDNTFAGAFQDVAVLPGLTGSFSVWQRAETLPLGLDVEMRIEWRNSVSNTEIARTPNLVSTPDVTTAYKQFTVSGLVPAGADTARAVYAIQTFSGGASNTGTLFVDDASFDLVPEPTTIGLFGIALVASIGMRRRRA